MYKIEVHYQNVKIPCDKFGDLMNKVKDIECLPYYLY